jgi:hypothetical protein
MKNEPYDPVGFVYLPRAAKELWGERNPESPARATRTPSRDQELVILEELRRAKVELFDAVREGRLATVYLDAEGKLQAIPRGWWLEKDSISRMENGRIDPAQPFVTGTGTNWIFANRDDFDRLLQPEPGGALSADSATSNWQPSEYLQFMIEQSRRLLKPNVVLTQGKLAEKLAAAWDSTHPKNKLGKVRSMYMASFLLKTGNKGRANKH